MEIVPFSLVKKLEEKGFQIEFKYALGYYDTRGQFMTAADHRFMEYWTIAPTISQVLKWLREEKKIYVEPCILADADTDADGKVINEYTFWSFSVTHIETGDMIYFEYERIDDKKFDSYELAALAGVEYCLDNLI